MAHELYTSRMMSRRTTRIVALVLALMTGLVCALGYNFVYDTNIRPKESALDY